MITDLVPSLSIENFLAQRDAMVERAATARKLLQEIEGIAEAMPTTARSGSWFRLELHTNPDRCSFAGDRGFESYVKAIDAACWARLLDLSGLRTFMDTAARAAWDKNISDHTVPPLTYDNVEATFTTLHSLRHDMFERGVIAVFRGLSWDYKTNNPVMFGKRLILTHTYDTRGGLIHVNHGGTDKIDDLMRAVCMLDGRPEPDRRHNAYQRLSVTRLGLTEFDGYFTIKGYKNGNGHLTFQRPDLVDRLNQIIGRHFPNALPPGRD